MHDMNKLYHRSEYCAEQVQKEYDKIAEHLRSFDYNITTPFTIEESRAVRNAIMMITIQSEHLTAHIADMKQNEPKKTILHRLFRK